MRVAIGLGAAVMLAACAGHVVDLGGSPADGGSDNDGSIGNDAGGPFTPTTMLLANCPDPASTSAVEGNGLNGQRPDACDAARGPVAAVSSPADVASLLVGTWYDCTHQAFGIDVSQEGQARAIQLTSDGQYLAYGMDDNLTLVPITQEPGDPRFDAGAATPSSTGTFTVVDGSATYGPGTYELQLRPADGGLFTGQVLVTTAPTQLHFLPTNQAEQIFTPAQPWSPRQGVCSCIDTTETAAFEGDPVGLANAILGKWMWCGGSESPFGNIGVEFAAGSTWYGLNEDASGIVTRDESALGHGTFQIVPTDSLNLGPAGVGPEPLTVKLNEATQFTLTQVLFFPNPRALLVGTGTNGAMEVYSTCLPMP
jgi:hypothetical protein